MASLTKNPATGFYTTVTISDGRSGELRNVHSPANCEGRGCAVHDHPSDHSLKAAPMSWHMDRNILERLCTHGVGHPDHDSAIYLASIGQDYENVHDCDGCC